MCRIPFHKAVLRAPMHTPSIGMQAAADYLVMNDTVCFCASAWGSILCRLSKAVQGSLGYPDICAEALCISHAVDDEHHYRTRWRRYIFADRLLPKEGHAVSPVLICVESQEVVLISLRGSQTGTFQPDRPCFMAHVFKWWEMHCPKR